MKSTISYLQTLLNIIFILIILLSAGLLFLSAPKNPTRTQLFTITSGSMSPAIPTGSIVLIKSHPPYQLEDIISYQTHANADLKKPGSIVTHRITKIHTDQNYPTYTTQGDANQTPDPEAVPQARVLGKVIFTLPYLGYVGTFIKSPPGFIILIVIPATVIVFQELQVLSSELLNIYRHRSRNPKSPKKHS